MERLTYWNEEYGCWSYRGPSGEAAKRLAAYEDAMTLERAKEFAQAEKAGRLVVLPEVPEADRQAFVDGLHDYFQEAANYDPSVGIFGMREGETELANALMEALTLQEAEAALREEGTE